MRRYTCVVQHKNYSGNYFNLLSTFGDYEIITIWHFPIADPRRHVGTKKNLLGYRDAPFLAAAPASKFALRQMWVSLNVFIFSRHL